ncbi:hypothetical protein CW740_04320 [Kangiella profundi]|uniref:Uncharacterized protein n=1 Tax=Kangiella profundi TaxID=1561924 RepID=A0A2K9B0R4_9GAMM|nr:hypothetical protein CW740_04320 [Kangiella profundi]
MGVGGSSPLATTKFKKAVLVTVFLYLKEMDENHRRWFDKVVGSDFEQTLVWPEGREQDSPSSPLAIVILCNHFGYKVF